MNTDNIIADLLDAMQHAIRAGDWKVDGACDPDTAMERAVHVLRSRGWTQNSIDGSWMRPEQLEAMAWWMRNKLAQI